MQLSYAVPTPLEYFAALVQSDAEFPLLEAAVSLAQDEYPDLDVQQVLGDVDQMLARLKRRIPADAVPLQKLRAVNQFFFRDLSFRANINNYYDPDNSYLNRVIDRRTGNPISLSLLYWLLGRRVGLPIVGIAMPGHFICRHQTSTESVFIDAFNRGKLLARSDCVRFLHQSGHGFHESYLTPATPRGTLLRVCTNLHEVYADRGLREETARLRRYLVALSG